MAERFPGLALKLVNGDLSFSNDAFGNLSPDTVDGVEEIRQAISIRLATRLGTDDFAPSTGLPFDTMVGIFNEHLISGKILEALALEPRVADASIGNISLDRPNRTVTLELNLTLIDGTDLTLEEAFAL